MSGDDSNLSDFSMMELFRTEVENQASLFNSELLGLEENPRDPARIEALMRAAHSIKGAARIVGLESAVNIAHAMEDALVAAQNRLIVLESNGIDLLLRGIDFLGRIGQVMEADQPVWQQTHADEVNQLGVQLAALRDGNLGSPAPAAAPAPSLPSPPSAAAIPASGQPLSAGSEFNSSSAKNSSPESLADFSMLDLFRGEVETQAGLLNEGLLGLETSPNSAETLQNLMRAAHSIKGAARIVGLDPAVKLARAMEEAFVTAQEGKINLHPDTVSILLKGVDFLDKLGHESEADIPPWLSAQEATLARLCEEIDAVRTGRAPATVVPPDSAAGPHPMLPDSEGLAGMLVKPAGSTPPAAIAPAATPVEPTPLAESKDHTVKVTAENLNRLMSLAAESLVESRQIQPFTDQLIGLKKSLQRLSGMLAGIRDAMEQAPAQGKTRELFYETQHRLEECRRHLALRIDHFEEFSGRLTNLSDRLYREVLSSRMRPFASGAQGFPRLVRDLARVLNKKVKFMFTGKNTPVDRDILERLEAPLTHILRNALDHGMELPAVRAQAGKPEEGVLRLEARHRAGMLLIEVTDDGRGIDLARVKTKIIERQLSKPELVAQMSETELLDFLFLPGFSTAEKITEISGRGVGLDVVRTVVHEAGGTVRIFSEFGKGTTFQLQLPITRSVIRALLVKIAGEAYAFPLARIDRALKIPWADLKTIENRPYFHLDGHNVGLVSAHEVLNLAGPRPADAEASVVVVSDRANQYGLSVDGFLGERDLVVRPLDPRLGKVPDISSASLMEDGTPLLIIDVEDMVRSIVTLLGDGGLKHSARSCEADGPRQKKRVLVVDDSVTVREVERKFLENQGYEVDVAVDGREGWNAVRLGHYNLVISDVDMPRMNGLELVRLIRQDARLKSLPVMIVSYKDREEDRMRGLEAGANYYFTKSSFHDATMINAVHDLIGAPDA